RGAARTLNGEEVGTLLPPALLRWAVAAFLAEPFKLPVKIGPRVFRRAFKDFLVLLLLIHHVLVSRLVETLGAFLGLGDFELRDAHFHGIEAVLLETNVAQAAALGFLFVARLFASFEAGEELVGDFLDDLRFVERIVGLRQLSSALEQLLGKLTLVVG